METIQLPGAHLPPSVFEAVRDGGWSIESQLARIHYTKSGRRYGLTYAELLLRALEIASGSGARTFDESIGAKRRRQILEKNSDARIGFQ